MTLNEGLVLDGNEIRWIQLPRKPESVLDPIEVKYHQKPWSNMQYEGRRIIGMEFWRWSSEQGR